MQEYLEQYEMVLTARSPIFIGSGTSYTKKEYLYHVPTRKVHILRREALLRWIVAENLLDRYERFILKNSRLYLYDFLTENHIRPQELEEMTLYTVDVTEAMAEGESLKEIQAFSRAPDGLPYVPGSSVKGALRTAVLTKLLQDGRAGELGGRVFDYGGQFQRNAAQIIETALLHTLRCAPQKRADAVNSMMRGISVSDSRPLRIEDITIAGKNDLSTAGQVGRINLLRECIKPGTKVHLSFTLDRHLTEGFTMEMLQAAIAAYGAYYQKTYDLKFRKPENAHGDDFRQCLILGGGSGYFSKNIVYPLLGERDALPKVSALLQRAFSKHHHERDLAIGISPRCLKHTLYRRQSYHFGVCRVDFIRKGF